jgi:hypothetical protein
VDGVEDRRREPCVSRRREPAREGHLAEREREHRREGAEHRRGDPGSLDPEHLAEATRAVDRGQAALVERSTS